MRELLEGLIVQFNARVKSDPKLSAELEGLERTVNVELADGRRFHFILRDRRIDALNDGPAARPDITIQSDEATLVGLIRREIGPYRAVFSGKLKLKGDLEDLARFRKFF